MSRLAVLVLVLAGCYSLGTEVRIWGKRPMDPIPHEYPTWYAEVEECLGMTGDFEAVEWFVADSIVTETGYSAPGAIELPNDVSIIPGRVFTESVIKHESVHHVMQSGDEIHGIERYEACRGH